MSDIKALVKSWVNSSEEFSVDFDLLWQGLGYSQKGHAVRKFESSGMVDGQDFRILSKTGKNSPGQPAKHYWLTVDAAKSFCMMAQTDTGRQVRQYFLECERQLKQILQQPARTLSDREVLEIAQEALHRRISQERFCEDKPGLKRIVEFISQPQTLDAPKAGVEAITRYHFNVELTKGELNSLGRLCAATYRTWHNAEPERDLDYHNGSTSPYPVCVYGTEMYATIENWLVNKGHSVAS